MFLKGSFGKWSNRISKVALTKTIKTLTQCCVVQSYILQMLPECFCINVGQNLLFLHHSMYRMSLFEACFSHKMSGAGYLVDVPVSRETC